MTSPNLDEDIAEADFELAPTIERIKGLLQMWHMFQSSKTVVDEFRQNFDDLSFPIRMACTRSFVVDYYKPWSGNFSKEINALKYFSTKKKWSYPFLSAIIAKDEHNEIQELRNSIVAHLDQNFESTDVTLKGIRIKNEPQHRPRDPGTLDEVLLPALTTLVGKRGLWCLSSSEKLDGLRAHIDEAKKAVEEEIRRSTAAFRDMCIQHMHVLGHLSNLFNFVEIPFVNGRAAVDPHHENPTPLTTGKPVELKIGDQNIQSLVTVYEPRPEYPSNTKISGRGYMLTLGEFSSEGNLPMNVSFPKYPFPKGKDD